MEDRYATALLRAIAGAAATSHQGILDRFIAMIKKRGHERLLPRMLSAYEQLLKKATEQAGVRLYTATPASEAERVAVTTEYGQVQNIVDPSLIGGSVLETPSLRIDRSYKRSLITLYRSLTN